MYRLRLIWIKRQMYMLKLFDEAGNVTVADLTASGSQPFYIHKAAPAITVT